MNRERVDCLQPAPVPEPDVILQVRTGKIKKLGKEQSGIFKEPCEGTIFVGSTGIVGDEHDYASHGGIHRAVHQYATGNYSKWRAEVPGKAHLFEPGAFGENLTSQTMNEENVCIGDLYTVGRESGVILQVSEPRNPCYKLNIRFQWSNALKRIQRTGRVGWNMRVLQTGKIEPGDVMALIERPYPKWSVMNVQRVLHGKDVDRALIEELSEIDVLSPYFHNVALKRLDHATRTYRLTDAVFITPRIRQLTFQAVTSITDSNTAFRPYAYAAIKFGPSRSISRPYSIVSGDLNGFTLAVALDDATKGGSRYLHSMELGDEIGMAPGLDAEASKKLEHFDEEHINQRIVIVGGVGITSVLMQLRRWDQAGLSYHVHYAVRSLQDAAYLDWLPRDRTTVHAKSEGQRLNIDAIVPEMSTRQGAHSSVFCCGPPRLMKACEQRTKQLGYPPHSVHLESFSAPIDDLGRPFTVDVEDIFKDRKTTLQISSDKTLLRALNDAGFDVMSSCQTGSCGACKVTLCHGDVEHKTKTLDDEERKVAMLSCVDRGIGRIAIEVD